MALSTKQLQAVLNEIGSDLIGGVIRRIDQPQAWTIVFEIDRQGKRHRLLFSAHKQHARCHLVTNTGPNPKTPPQFCQLLRAHLRHKRILSLEQLNADRIIEIRVGWTEGVETIPTVFIAELTGTTSNMFLLKAQGMVFGSLFSSCRKNIAIGNIYQTPKIKPLASFKETPIPLIGSWNRSIACFYRELEEKEAQEATKDRLLRQLNKAIHQNKDRLKKFSSRLAEAEAASQFRDYGEMLKSQLRVIKPGAHEFRYIDPMDPEEKTVRIQLNPALSPTKNMASFFQRYKKAVYAKTFLIETIEKTGNQLAHLEQAKEGVMGDAVLQFDVLPILPKKRIEQKKNRVTPGFICPRTTCA